MWFQIEVPHWKCNQIAHVVMLTCTLTTTMLPRYLANNNHIMTICFVFLSSCRLEMEKNMQYNRLAGCQLAFTNKTKIRWKSLIIDIFFFYRIWILVFLQVSVSQGRHSLTLLPSKSRDNIQVKDSQVSVSSGISILYLGV